MWSFELLVDATGLNLTVDGVDCQPGSWDSPSVRCVLGVSSGSRCSVSSSTCGLAVADNIPVGVVYAAGWSMTRWTPLVQPSNYTLCPPVTAAMVKQLDYGYPQCVDMQLRRSQARGVTVHAPDAGGTFRTGVCVGAGSTKSEKSIFASFWVLSSMACSFDGRRWSVQAAELPVAMVRGTMAVHKQRMYMFGGSQGWSQTCIGEQCTSSAPAQGLWAADIIPCRADSNSSSCAGGEPWEVSTWSLVLPYAPPLMGRYFVAMYSLYGIGRRAGDPSLQGLRGPPWEQQQVQPSLVVAGGVDEEDPEKWIEDLWMLDETTTPPSWTRISASLPPPPAALPTADDNTFDVAASGSYFLFDYRGNYSAAGPTFPAVSPDTWPYASGALILIAGSETYYSVDGGVSWNRMLNFQVDGADPGSGSLQSPLWSGWISSDGAAIVGTDGRGVLQIKGVPQPANAGYTPIRVFQSISGCGACPAGQRSTGCDASGGGSTCAACTVCESNQYASEECGGLSIFSDRVCSVCSVCGAGLLVASACNATHDTICVAGASLGEQEAWLHASAVVSSLSVAGVVVALVRVAVLLVGQSGSATASAGVAAAGANSVASRVVHETWVLRLSLSYGLLLCRLCMVACAAAVLHCDRCSSDVAVHARAVVALLSLSFVVQTLVGSHMLVRFTRLLGMEGHRESLLDLQLQRPGLSLLLHSGCLLHSSNLGAWLDPWLYVGSSKSSVKPRVRSGNVSRALSTASLVSFVVVDVPVLVSSCVFVAGVARSADWRGVVEPSGVSVFSPFVGWSLYVVGSCSMVLTVCSACHTCVSAFNGCNRAPSLVRGGAAADAAVIGGANQPALNPASRNSKTTTPESHSLSDLQLAIVTESPVRAAQRSQLPVEEGQEQEPPQLQLQRGTGQPMHVFAGGAHPPSKQYDSANEKSIVGLLSLR